MLLHHHNMNMNMLTDIEGDDAPDAPSELAINDESNLVAGGGDDWNKMSIGKDETNKHNSYQTNANANAPCCFVPINYSYPTSLSKQWRLCKQNPLIVVISSFVFALLIGAGVAICFVFASYKQKQVEDAALELAVSTGSFFSGELDKALLPLFSMAQFVLEIPIFKKLPMDIGPAGGNFSLPLLPPLSPGAPITHRNVTGVCDEPDLVQRFTEIASTIKRNAKMQGVLVNIQLAPQAVVCLLHPLNNTEDFEDGVFMDNSGAWGLDLLTDPKSKFGAQTTLQRKAVVIVGPLSLRQCQGCDATVEKAFIARLPIFVDDYEIVVDGIPYPEWGFATVLINWQELVNRSGIFEMFRARDMEFQLTRTDQKYNAETDSFYQEVSSRQVAKFHLHTCLHSWTHASNFVSTPLLLYFLGHFLYSHRLLLLRTSTTILLLLLCFQVVVLSMSPQFGRRETFFEKVTTALQTTNDEWEMTIEYDANDGSRWLVGCIVSCVVLSLCISFLVFTILIQREIQTEMQTEALAQDARVETERNMTAYFAHELRNPLGAMDSALQAMPDELSRDARALVDGMQVSIHFMSSIMNNLLDARKMEEGKMALHPRPLTLQKLVLNLHKMLLPSVKQGVDFRTSIHTYGRNWVLGDLHRLQQVMTNVITNAIKYTVTGSITLWIGWADENHSKKTTRTATGTTYGTPMLKFACIDTGPGIPISEQSTLFQRFVQRGGAPGTGLGLAISKYLVDAMGGTIHFESDPTLRPGTSCIVYVPLPLCEQPEQPITTANLSSELRPIQESFSILIIDDIKINRSMLKRRFQKGIAPKCIITEAATGEQALGLFELGRNFDVIIIDQYMEEAGGVMIGTDVVYAMRRMGLQSYIIGCSGNDVDTKFYEAGVDGVWRKPVPSNTAIIQELRGVLREKRAHSDTVSRTDSSAS
jgi:signal transduction histidine kinase/CheY-like chemotaxis protein/sensor domain CHASE-containing protein